MKPQNIPFILTEDHLRYGLTGEDMSAYTGIPVCVAYHDDFPHSKELRKYFHLRKKERRERNAAGTRYLKKMDFSKAIIREARFGEIESAFCCGDEERINISHIHTDASGAWNPCDINQRYLLRSKDEEFRDRWVVVPKAFGVSVQDHFASSGPMLKSRAFVILDPRRQTPEEFWSFCTDLPKHRITRFPNMRICKFVMGAHEMRHIIQVYVSDRSLSGEYHEEVDADLFARALLRDQLPALRINPRKHLRQDLMTRYTSMLTNDYSYQIAPALEAFEAGKTPPPLQAVNIATKEICGHIITKENGKRPTNRRREKLFNRFLEEPEVVYSLLRRCAKDGDFSHNELSTHIVSRVLQSVEYFSKDLTRNPDVINKIYPARQGIRL